MKAEAEIPLETVRATIAEWPENLKACVEAEGGHFEWHYYKQKLKKLLLINYLAQKVDVLFHFPSRSQYTWDRTYGRTVYIISSFQKRSVVGIQKNCTLDDIYIYGEVGVMCAQLIG
jgi:hypothetical protein